MEPPNFHQEQFTGYFSSLLSLPPPDNKPQLAALTSTNPSNTTHFIHSQDLMLSGNDSNYHNYHHQQLLESSISRDGYSWPPPPPPLRSSMINIDLQSFAANDDLLFSKIKEEMPETFPKLSGMNLYGNSSPSKTSAGAPPPPVVLDHNSSSNNRPSLLFNDYFTSTTASGFSAEGHRHLFYTTSHDDTNDIKGTNYFVNSGSQQDSSCCSRSYSHVMPSINVLTSDLCSSLVSSSLDLNLRAADHHHHRHLNLTSASSYDGITAGNSSLNSTTSRKSINHHFMGDSPTHSSNNNSKKSSGTDQDVSLGRKSSSCKRPITTFSGSTSSSSSKNLNPTDDNKKQRSTSKPSCPPLKVRKEKLGDRIAALQRLVAPYGKTDTASVLTEAIGYIQFLHDQVQTLSVPYMRSPSNNNKPNRALMLRSSSEEDHHHPHGKGQSVKKDLTSRGLCLVPQSFASYLNGYNVDI